MGWLESLANTIVTFSGNGFDPDASPLPTFKPKAPPTAKLQEKKPKKAADVTREDLLTDEELRAGNWKYRGRPMSEREIQEMKKEASRKKVVQIDLDEVDNDRHGLTEREYGEMLVYNPPLTNTRLAMQVKEKKAKGLTLAEIAAQLGQSEQTIRHYSSALFKASPIKKPRK